MRVLVTGGTGFIGSHTVRAVTAAGHDVHLLVRSPARIAPALGPLEVNPPQHTVGDATDPDAMRVALDGCDATIHCAAIYSFNPRDRARMAAPNRRAAEVVLGESLERGCDPVVYCSSLVSLLPVRTPRLRQRHPWVTLACHTCSKGRRRACRARPSGGWGAAVLPGGVIGSHDPYVGETNEYWIRRPLRGMLPSASRVELPRWSTCARWLPCLQHLSRRAAVPVPTSPVGTSRGTTRSPYCGA